MPRSAAVRVIFAPASTAAEESDMVPLKVAVMVCWAIRNELENRTDAIVIHNSLEQILLCILASLRVPSFGSLSLYLRGNEFSEVGQDKICQISQPEPLRFYRDEVGVGNLLSENVGVKRQR